MFVEACYHKWLCDVLLFELHMGLSGLLVCGGRTEQRERMPRGTTQLAACDSGAVGGPVPLTVTS